MSHPTITLALLDALHEKWHQRYMALSAKDSEKRVGRATSEAANDLGDIIEAYESERLASDEPADQMRTPPEAISSRIVIPHASFSLEMTSDGISPDLYATLTGHPVAVEDDVPVPRPEPAEITEEPPVGSQITDNEGDVWERRSGWALWDKGVHEWESDGGEWRPDVQRYAPLRPTTDEDRERVGLPVEPAPADVDPDEAGGEGGPEPKAELDEVEALARDLYHASLLIPPVKEIGPTTWLSERDHRMWLGVARAAREHIEANQLYAYRPVAAERDKAETDLARVTKERDEQARDAIEWRNRYGALRADVAEYVGCMGAVSAFTKVQLLAVRNRLKSILAADANRVAERAES